ncbi:hypothetical protein [Streptomyces sp. CBMA123]|uniref:hypothetical protein n=1 Tax=Streptomyces sp. CBMA123 TaxID=1896313 RepID=UPI0016619A24|nr:hypothetical protein [Streptomyces sp. CBMA123]MBD0689962.1 hypothetical protein [Streptomyces sp. CBMA123]
MALLLYLRLLKLGGLGGQLAAVGEHSADLLGGVRLSQGRIVQLRGPVSQAAPVQVATVHRISTWSRLGPAR